MRVVSVDQFEFENPSSEESVEIAVAKRSDFPFPDVAHFVAVRRSGEAHSALDQPVPFAETLAYGLVRGYLQRFSGIAIPERCAWPTYVFQDGPDDWELVMCAPDCYIHYLWSTAA